MVYYESTLALVDDDGCFARASQLRHGDVDLHERGQSIIPPLCPVSVRGNEEGLRPTVVLHALESGGDLIALVREPSLRELATRAFVTHLSPTRELQRPLPCGGGHQTHVEAVGHQNAEPLPGGRSLHEA